MPGKIDYPRCSAYCNRYFHFHTHTETITKDLLAENRKTQNSILVFILFPLQSNSHKDKTLHGRVTLTLLCATMAVISTLVTAVFYGVIAIIFVLERSYLLVFPDQLLLIEKQIREMEQTLQKQKMVLEETASLEAPLRELAGQIVSFQHVLATIDEDQRLSVSTILDKSRRLEERVEEARKVFDWILNYLKEKFFIGDMKDGMQLSTKRKTNFQQMAEHARDLEKVTEDLLEIEQEIEKLDREINVFTAQLNQHKQQLEKLCKDGALTHDAYQQALIDLAQQLQLIGEDKYVQLSKPRIVLV